MHVWNTILVSFLGRGMAYFQGRTVTVSFGEGNTQHPCRILMEITTRMTDLLKQIHRIRRFLTTEMLREDDVPKYRKIAMVKVVAFFWGMGDLPPLMTESLFHGYINPYYWVDDHSLLYGNNGSLDPGTYVWCLKDKKLGSNPVALGTPPQSTQHTQKRSTPRPLIWAIYYKSLTWFKAILGGIPLLNHHLRWPRLRLL